MTRMQRCLSQPLVALRVRLRGNGQEPDDIWDVARLLRNNGRR